MNPGERLPLVLACGLHILPAKRRELGAAMLAEAIALDPGRSRRQWLLSTYWFIIKEGTMTLLKLAAIGGSALFVLWILYNGVDSGFAGTPVQIASMVGLITLLTLNIVLLSRGLLTQRHRAGR